MTRVHSSAILYPGERTSSRSGGRSRAFSLLAAVVAAGALVASGFVAGSPNAHASTSTDVAASAALQCLTASEDYPWGMIAARTWTPNNAQPNAGTVGNPGIAQGAPFEARLVQAYGRDTANSKQMVILETPDGCRAAYPAVSFIEDDRSHVRQVALEHPLATDSAVYDREYEPHLVTPEHVAAGKVRVHDTQHFAIFYGTNTSAFSYRYQAGRGIHWDSGIRTLGEFMEQSYAEVRDLTGAKMPYADVASKKKLNIYVCGTGLPWFDDTGDCGASAGRSMFVSAVYIQDGSSTMVHEFGHVLQVFSGGFTGGYPGVGKVWEAHANWVSARTSPTFNIWYFQNLENGPTWWTNRYGWFPLILQLSEQDRTRPYVWRAWHENLRDSQGNSREDYLETVVRLGQADGVYPKGFASFADDAGWYGARLAANDFQQGKVFADTQSFPQEGSRYVGLTPTDTVATYASSEERPLWQFGSHIIPLDVEPTAPSVSVAVNGRNTSSTAGWRYALVGVAPGKRPLYSDLGAATSVTGKTVTVPIEAGRKYFLAVTATPSVYETQGATDTPETTPSTFPYTAQLQGARPDLPGMGTCLGPYTDADSKNLNWNTNGHFPWDQNCQRVGKGADIVADPASVTVDQGASAQFSVGVSGPATIRWQTFAPASSTWSTVAGATSTTVTLPSQLANGTRVRALVASEGRGELSTFPATLTVRAQQANVTAVASTRCVAKKPTLVVQVRNAGDKAVRAVISTPLGERTIVRLDPGASSAAVFTARSSTLAAGEVNVTATIIGEAESSSSRATYAPRTCR